MINDPNYDLPKDAFIRLFDNPIPAGSPDRQAEGVPEWAQELDEVVVWAHMGENGQVTVKVNGEDIGGGGESELLEIELTAPSGLNIPCYIEGLFDVGVWGIITTDGTPVSLQIAKNTIIGIGVNEVSPSSTAEYTDYDGALLITGSGNLIIQGVE